MANYAGAVQTGLEQLPARLAADPHFGQGEIRIGRGGVADLVVPVRGDPAGTRRPPPCVTCVTRSFRAAFEGDRRRSAVGGATSENIDYLDNVTNPAPSCSRSSSGCRSCC